VSCCFDMCVIGTDDSQSVASIRGIRAMALQGVFREKFELEAAAAKKTGDRTAWIIGIGTSASAAVPLFAQGGGSGVDRSV
jgi:hypothetical protein